VLPFLRRGTAAGDADFCIDEREHSDGRFAERAETVEMIEGEKSATASLASSARYSRGDVAAERRTRAPSN
jgi:hypothetical protein